MVRRWVRALEPPPLSRAGIGEGVRKSLSGKARTSKKCELRPLQPTGRILWLQLLGQELPASRGKEISETWWCPRILLDRRSNRSKPAALGTFHMTRLQAKPNSALSRRQPFLLGPWQPSSGSFPTLCHSEPVCCRRNLAFFPAQQSALGKPKESPKYNFSATRSCTWITNELIHSHLTLQSKEHRLEIIGLKSPFYQAP